MSEPLKVTGMVLQAVPYGDYNKRLVILTKERGKITAFAKSVRKPGSMLMGACNAFVFGTFTVYEGRDAYTLTHAEVKNYFREVREDLTATFYGCYFMEVAEYYTRENLDGSAMLNLLYVTLRALMNEKLDRELIRTIYEMKAMVLNGEYPYETANDPSLHESTRYAISFVLQSPLQKLYTFTLKPEIQREFRRVQDFFNQRNIDRKFKSLDMLKGMTAGL